MWIAVENKNADMLTADVYDAFLFLPLYMAMYYHTELIIDGNVSRELYRNMVDYIQPLLCYFSSSVSPEKVTVLGYKDAFLSEHRVIGTGISCGVDSLSTIYKYHECEEDSDYRLTGLFMINCGWHGKYGEKSTIDLFHKRCKKNKQAADEMGLSFYTIDSNLHAFLPWLDDQASFWSMYTCIFALERGIKRYYYSSSLSYDEIIKYGQNAKDRDWSEYADSSAIPLMRTSCTEVVSDGCQYSRSKKTELISNWRISKKYLNVCCGNISENNCSICGKCIRTLLAIEAMGMLDEYKDIFDIEKWKKISYVEKCRVSYYFQKDAWCTDNYNFLLEHDVKMPTKIGAFIGLIPQKLVKIRKRYIGNRR